MEKYLLLKCENIEIIMSFFFGDQLDIGWIVVGVMYFLSIFVLNFVRLYFVRSLV